VVTPLQLGDSSPDVAARNFHLFGPHKKNLPGKWFWTDADAKQVVTFWLQTINTDIFYAQMQAQVPRLDRRLNVNGDYVEVWCVPSERRDSLVGIATRYGLDDTGIESGWGSRFSTPVQTDPGAHPASYTIGTGSLPGGKAAGAWRRTPTPI